MLALPESAIIQCFIHGTCHHPVKNAQKTADPIRVMSATSQFQTLGDLVGFTPATLYLGCPEPKNGLYRLASRLGRSAVLVRGVSIFLGSLPCVSAPAIFSYEMQTSLHAAERSVGK